jgi:voltage-gated potassium channel
LLYVSGSYERYGDALHAAAMSTITGNELTATDGFARLLEVVLAVYSVAVFATLAGAVGAFFLRGSGAEEPALPNAEGDS